MPHDISAPRCRICARPIHPCNIPPGAHMLCKPTAECRHEVCEALHGDPDNDHQLAVCEYERTRP
jgi:hypothetical protein